MAQVSRSAFATSLGTKINDNTSGDISAQDVREVFTDLEDSAVWYDEGVVRNATANLTAGYTTTPHSLGTVTSGTVTPAFANGNIQTVTNNGAFTLAVPTGGSGSMRLEVVNGASAGAITTSAYNSVIGSFTTTNGARFLCSAEVIGSHSYLIITAA